MLRASEGDPYDTSPPESSLDDLRELMDAAQELRSEQWLAVSDAEGEIGVVLPQRFSGAPEAGTLYYVAVIPQRRGQGLGRRLHRLGLERLRALGVERYVGSTDPTNTAMRSVFAANGCTEENPED